MASPFNVFRRNQRAMLAVAGVAIMIVFVLGDPITKYLGHAGGTENPVIVKANSHSYRASELIALVQSRRVVEKFSSAVGAGVRAKGGGGQIRSRRNKSPRVPKTWPRIGARN